MSPDLPTTANPPPPPALAAGLYVVATPIGNLRDITLRALDVLKGAALVLCEDTRVTAKLMSHFGLTAPLAAYHDHNAERVRPKVLAALARGDAVALVSDAGTPLISDPGYKLVRAARAEGHEVFAVPGASSVTAALSIAGLPTDRFLFLGFLPPKTTARRRALGEVAGLAASLVVLEAPARLAATLADMADILGPREATVARELTKLYEEVRRAPLGELAAHYAAEGPPKGEIVIVVGPGDVRAAHDDEVTQALERGLAGGMSLKDAVDAVTAETGRARREVYALALALKAPAS